MKTWRKRMGQRLNEIDMKQNEFSKILNLTPAVVGHWLTDKPTSQRTPSLEQFIAAADVLKVTPEWLVFGIVADEIDHTRLLMCIAAVEEVEKMEQTKYSPVKKIRLAIRGYRKYSSKPASKKTLRGFFLRIVGPQ